MPAGWQKWQETTNDVQRLNVISITYLGHNGRWWFCLCRECLNLLALIAPIGQLVAATIAYGGTLIDIIVQIAGVLSWTDRNHITYESMEPKLNSLPTCRKRRLAQT